MTRYCEECGCDVQEIVQIFPGHLRKECAECGSTGCRDDRGGRNRVILTGNIYPCSRTVLLREIGTRTAPGDSRHLGTRNGSRDPARRRALWGSPRAELGADGIVPIDGRHLVPTTA